MLVSRDSSKEPFEFGRFFEKTYPIILQPVVIDLPRLCLVPYLFFFHNQFGGQQAEEAKLGESAKEEA
jgi:hypothetical protein